MTQDLCHEEIENQLYHRPFHPRQCVKQALAQIVTGRHYFEAPDIKCFRVIMCLMMSNFRTLSSLLGTMTSFYVCMVEKWSMTIICGYCRCLMTLYLITISEGTHTTLTERERERERERAVIFVIVSQGVFRVLSVYLDSRLPFWVCFEWWVSMWSFGSRDGWICDHWFSFV
jgi:hypothetical protein